MLRGNKVYLRPFEEDDIKNTVKWLNSIELGALIDRVIPSTMHEREEWFHAISRDKTAVTFAIALAKNDHHIGNCGLMNIDNRSRRAQFWIYLADGYTGHGFGNEAMKLILDYAFQSLNLNRIYLYVVSTNIHALQFYQKIGFKIEGTFREHVYLKGRYEDAIWLGILKNDYYSSPAKRQKP